jgi:3-oxoacyl-[acyl-carrier protein] reductase
MNRLQEKVAVITGGTSGFGYAIAELFAREGANVVIGARRKEKGEMAIKKIKKLTGADVRFFQCNVSKESEVKDLVHKTIDLYKRIDILVNNAGTINRKDFEDTTEEEWGQMMDVNLKGSFFCCKHTIPFMIKNGKGSIINISSNTGLVGRGDVPVYSASKGGLILLAKSLALRYAKNNVRVNCICPSFIITDLNREVIEKAPDPAKKLKELESTHPLGRLGTPNDVAYAAVYLASDESQWVTGITLPVDGGYTAG